MNKELIMERREALMKDRKQHEAMAMLIDGALQDCEYWLTKLESGDESDKEIEE